MNKVHKSNNIPEILTTKGITLRDALIEDVKNGKKKLSFDRNVYADKSVKTQLKNEQNKKCAYCERYFNGDFGAVEHFRPKGGYSLLYKGKEKLIQPGYYWLAYDWDNLLYSCSECNTSYKKNWFPLLDEAKRDIASKDISKEEALLINPASEDPGDFFEFHQHIIVAKGGNTKGNTTIEVLKLNDRMDLVERRRGKWEEYKMHLLILKIAQDLKNRQLLDIGQFLLTSLTDEKAEFTGMFKYQQNNI